METNWFEEVAAEYESQRILAGSLPIHEGWQGDKFQLEDMMILGKYVENYGVAGEEQTLKINTKI